MPLKATTKKAMTRFATQLEPLAESLRSIQWLSQLGVQSDDSHVLIPPDEPAVLNFDFWSKRTHELEEIALNRIDDHDIDEIFCFVAEVMDDNLSRFNPIIDYFSRFYTEEMDISLKMESETEVAHSIKRDLAWMAVEKVIGVNGFFCSLMTWYECGRWPYDWNGLYPSGHLVCL